MYWSITLILKHLKTLKNTPACFDLYSDHPQGARSFLIKVTDFKITKYIKGPYGNVAAYCKWI